MERELGMRYAAVNCRSTMLWVRKKLNQKNRSISTATQLLIAGDDSSVNGNSKDKSNILMSQNQNLHDFKEKESFNGHKGTYDGEQKASFSNISALSCVILLANVTKF